MEYKLISTDDHLQEPADLWTTRMSGAKWGDRIPQLRTNPDNSESWFIYGKPYIKYGRPVIGAVRGVTKDRKMPTRWDEVPRITYVPSERVKAMDEQGVDVQTFFGNITGIAGNTFSIPDFGDEEFRLECIRAYNDFQIEAYAAPYPGRFITLAVLPMWDAGAALAEAQRTAKRGIKGITFAFPQQFGFPHICDRHWDPLWSFAQEADLPINFHVGGGGGMGLSAEVWTGNPAAMVGALGSTKAIAANVEVMTDLLFSGILERFPKLKIVSSESGVGWVPYLLESADHAWEHYACAKDGMPLKPSEYFRRQCYVNFWFEVQGLQMMKAHVGLDNVMFGADFPHPTGTWPNTREYVQRSVAPFSREDRDKVMFGNAVRLFKL